MHDTEALAEQAAEAATLLRLIANEKRLLLLCVLLRAREMAVGPLAETIGLSQPALSQHLALLRDAGVLATRREGQSILYRVTEPRVARLLALLQTLYDEED